MMYMWYIKNYDYPGRYVYHFGAYPGQDGDWWNPSESTFMIPPTSWEIE